MLQCVAVRCSVLQSSALLASQCCSVLQCGAVCVAVRCSALQCVQKKRVFPALKRSGCVLQCVAVRHSMLQCVAVFFSVVQCGAVCCSVLQCVAVCRSVLQCVAVHCSECKEKSLPRDEA